MEPEVTSPAEKDAETLPDWDQLSFRLLSVQALRGDGEVRLPQQLNFCYALILVTGGAVRIHVDHRKVELSAGSVCLCLPEQTVGTAKPAASLICIFFILKSIITASRRTFVAMQSMTHFCFRRISYCSTFQLSISLRSIVKFSGYPGQDNRTLAFARR